MMTSNFPNASSCCDKCGYRLSQHSEPECLRIQERDKKNRERTKKIQQILDSGIVSASYTPEGLFLKCKNGITLVVEDREYDGGPWIHNEGKGGWEEDEFT